VLERLSLTPFPLPAKTGVAAGEGVRHVAAAAVAATAGEAAMPAGAPKGAGRQVAGTAAATRSNKVRAWRSAVLACAGVTCPLSPLQQQVQ
jgi:hypothetical protein